MATSFKKTVIVNPLTFGEASTEDTRYWANLDQPITKKEFGHVTHIEFSPVAPFNMAVTSSARVQIYSSRSNELVRKLNQFTKSATCSSYRSDGKLLVAGDDCKIRIFDPTNRAMMRSLSGHTDAVLATRFLADKQTIMSTSKDKTVRLWDIATEGEVQSYKEFKDYVKCGVASVSNQDMFLAGSYDHTARLFDRRNDSSVMSFEHGSCIESVLLFPSNGIVLTAGGNVVKVWDVLAGGRQLSQLTHHHKTIMDMCFCSNYRRFMSASSDRHIKIYDVATYQVVHTLDYPANILSVAVSPDDSVLAVGMEGGLLSIRHRNKAEAKAQSQTGRKRKAPYHYHYHPHSFKPHGDDVVVTMKKKEKLERFDKLLKRFEHSKALDAALEPHVRQQNAEQTMGVIQELKRRGVLRAALAGRDVQQLQPMLKFIQKNVWKPNFSHLLDVMDILLETYGDQIKTNPALQSSIERVKDVMQGEVSYQAELAETKGVLGTFFASCSS
ncbi:U3 small nucleolar RNA-associated protein 15 homolog [Babylonia areolata]|uniref:U3 small nucleolar RNA-associated protein 15 homolog n=1 Tax=Babylonia areolata TaxID=304850 RepID=UPI003FD4CAFA